MMVYEKCKICGWDLGVCHNHHIIPLGKGGEDCKENIIVLCPNHHSEATEDFEIFNEKHNLKGVKVSDIKIKAMSKYMILLLDYIPSLSGKKEEIKDMPYFKKFLCVYLRLKFKFTHEEALANHIGMGIRSLIHTYYHESYQSYQKYAKEFKENVDAMLKSLIKKYPEFNHQLEYTLLKNV